MKILSIHLEVVFDAERKHNDTLRLRTDTQLTHGFPIRKEQFREDRPQNAVCFKPRLRNHYSSSYAQLDDSVSGCPQ
jgi:hypothetical protein